MSNNPTYTEPVIIPAQHTNKSNTNVHTQPHPKGSQVIQTGYIPREQQEYLHKNVKRFSVVVCHRRFGKCCTASTDVLTIQGWRKIHELVIGDFVYSSKGVPTKVTHTFINEVKDIYEVEFSNGTIVETDEEHLWHVEPSFAKIGKRSNREPWKCGKILSTGDLLKEENKEYKFIPVVQLQRGEQLVAIDPYFLGYWLGNGSKNTPLIVASYEDAFVLDKYEPSNISDYEKGCKRYYFKGKRDLFNKYNLFNNKHIPRCYLESSIEQRIELLKGLMDSDGSVSKEMGTCSFHNKNEKLVDDFVELLSSLGIIPYKHAYKRKSKIDESYEIEYTVLFTAKTFLPFSLERKNKYVRLNDRPIRHKIKEVRKTDRKEIVYCIKVAANDSLFLITKNLIPTHNSIFAINHLIHHATNNKLKNPQYAYIAPTFAAAKRIAWQYMHTYTENIPNVIFNEADLKLTFPHNHAKIFLLSADNYNSIRGIYLDGCVMDEVADMIPLTWTEAVRPALSDRRGWCLFLGTPRGKNHFKDWYDYASSKQNPEWFGASFKASETKIIPESELESAKATMGEDAYMQEYENSFSAGITGAYFAKEMEKIRALGQITTLNYDPTIPVHTYWDLGINDVTAIWFAQIHRSEYRFIDYYEQAGLSLEEIVAILKKKPYVYGEFVLPHDAEVRDLSTGKARKQILYNLGCRPIRVIPRVGAKMESISAFRSIIKNCYFDTNKCSRGIDALENYKKKWDEKSQSFADTPLHNWASNGADAIQQFAMGLREYDRNVISSTQKRWNADDNVFDTGAIPKSAYMDYDIFGAN